MQKTYTAEFKREAVRLAQTSGKPITHIARDLGISDTSIHQWRKVSFTVLSVNVLRENIFRQERKREAVPLITSKHFLTGHGDIPRSAT